MKLIDKVWFTYKARIRTSERLLSNNTHSQNLLVWYALIATTLAIIAIRYPQLLGQDTDITLAVLSVALLVMSLLVTNSDFKGRALQMRKNYLELQELYNTLNNESAHPESFVSAYGRLLDEVENHQSIDDKYWRVRFDPNTSRPATCKEKWDVYAYIVVRVSILVLLYIAPIVSILGLLATK